MLLLQASSTHSFIDAWSAFGMPPLERYSELRARIVNAVVPILIMHRPCHAVSAHVLRKMRQLLWRVVFQKGGSTGGISFGGFRNARLRRSSKIEELDFGCCKPQRLASERGSIVVNSRMLTTSHCCHALLSYLINLSLEHAPWVHAQHLSRVRI